MKELITHEWCPKARRYVAPEVAPTPAPAPKKKPAAKKPASK